MTFMLRNGTTQGLAQSNAQGKETTNQMFLCPHGLRTWGPLGRLAPFFS